MMKAFVFTKYGSPKVLKLTEIEKPTPSADQVLVKIHATAVNPLDWHIMRASPWLARTSAGLLRPKPENQILGADISGRVEAVGANITEFAVGDEVFGGRGAGGFAEYICVKETGLVHKPANISYEAASSIPVAGFTALQGLRNTGQISAGQKVLINGASGGVGTFAVQIAKYFGAEVTGVCSTRNLEMVKSIGADHVIDYTKGDFTENGVQYDLIFDAVGNLSVKQFQRALTPNGRAVVAGFTTMVHAIKFIFGSGRVSKRGTQTIGMMPTAQWIKEDLVLFKELLETGKIVPVIDRCYPFAQVPEAIGYLETGRARGKVVVNIIA
jgi:NADPH:quinone reductase-like Zn-dependent oxidoreductase